MVEWTNTKVSTQKTVLYLKKKKKRILVADFTLYAIKIILKTLFFFAFENKIEDKTSTLLY